MKSKFLDRTFLLQPIDIIALVVIVGSFILKYKGFDGTVSLVLTSVCFYYFGKKGREPIQNYDKTGKPSASD